jgi:hypothetical protein
VNRQNPDGSWYYYELAGGKASKIDNYHTGYVLESLSVIRHIQGSDFNYEEEFMKGSEYFLKNFFENGHIPKMTPSSVYPIDIQSCAQSIITLIELAGDKPEYREKAEAVLNYTINHFYSKKGWFYYRIGKRGRIHKTSYIRWGDAWMYLAIVRFLTFEQYD